MTDKTIAIYCFLDDLFKVMGPKSALHCKLNDAEIATTAIMAALSFRAIRLLLVAICNATTA